MVYIYMGYYARAVLYSDYGCEIWGQMVLAFSFICHVTLQKLPSVGELLCKMGEIIVFTS